MANGLAVDPLTGLNKFQQQQKASQAAAAGGYKPAVQPTGLSVSASAAPNAATQAEIDRKVQNGIALTNPNNAANNAAYASSQQAMLAEIQRKAAAGAGLTDPNAYKQGLYDQYKGAAAPAPGGAAAPAPGGGGVNPYAPSAALPQYQSSYNGPDTKGMTDQLNAIYANMSASQIQKLKDALAQQLQGYNSQETTANQNAYDNRNSNDVMSMQQMQAVREQMAAQGTAGGGDSITAQVANNAQRQNGANAINRDQANILQDLSQKRALAQDQAKSGELSLQQQIDSDKAAAMLQLLQYGDSRAFDVDQAKYGRFSDDLARQFQQQQFDYGKTQDQIQNDAQYGGTYGGQQTFAAKQQQIQNDAQYGGTYGGQKTVAQQQQDWNNRFDYGNAIGQFGNGQQTLAAKGQQFDQGMSTKNFNRGVLESDRNFNRGVLESDRNYGRGVLESDRDYGRGVLESDRNYGLSQDGNDLQWIKYANDQGAGQDYQGFTPNQVLDAVKGQFYDKDGYPKDGSKSIDPKKIYDTINSYGLPMGQDEQVMLSLGLTKDQIAQFDKASGVSAGK